MNTFYTKHFNFYHSYGNKGQMHEKYYGPEMGHVVIAGLIDAYLFTGDKRAMETARHLRDHNMRKFTQGEEKIRTLYGQQMRGIAWPALGLIRLGEITGDQNQNPPPLRFNVSDVLPVDVTVRFTMCMSGEVTDGAPCVIGSAPEIGGWGTGVDMANIDGELWQVDVVFAAGGKCDTRLA